MPTGVYERTKEHKRKIRLAKLGKHHTEETKEKIRLGNLGKHLTEETKKKLSIAFKGKPSGRLGKHHSEKSKEKMRLAHLGKHHSKEILEKMRISHKGLQIGENNSSWRGGKSFEPYTPEFNRQLKELIRQRDSYKCQLCGMPECENIRKLSIHHIDYIKKNCLPDNLITLCGSCNSKVNFDRDYWTEYFREKRRKYVEEK